MAYKPPEPGSWSPPNISQMACIYLVTFLVGFIGLAIIGNLIGGGIFVAVLNYSYIRKTQEIAQ